jgi:DNA-binding MarR family transcriptional regulator
VLEARIKARRADRSCTGAGSARARGWVAGLRGALDALEQRVGAERMTTPAFDVMLVLFVAREQGRGLSVAECCREAGLSSSTGLRHVTTLTEHGLIVQGDDPLDRRRRTLHLSPATSAAMEAWVRTLIDLSGCAPEARAA